MDKVSNETVSGSLVVTDISRKWRKIGEERSKGDKGDDGWGKGEKEETNECMETDDKEGTSETAVIREIVRGMEGSGISGY